MEYRNNNVVYSCKYHVVFCPKYRRHVHVDGVVDHVHMLLEVDPQLGIHKAVKRRIPSLWTNSYFVSTVGGAALSIVKQYIENQKKV